MDLSPQAIAAATFDTVRKGYDPEDVRKYLAQVAAQLEATQQQATAMEARARAAIAKLQELQQQGTAAPATHPAHDPTPSGAMPDEAETISRALLLAQRTADVTVAEAQAEAAALTSGAQAEAERVLEEARAAAATMIDEGRAEARRAKEGELTAAEGEVQSLLARRDFLLGDVEILEDHVGAQRDRLRGVIEVLQDLVERTPDGLGEVRLPPLSASADDTAETIEADATVREATPAEGLPVGVNSGAEPAAS